MAIYHFSAKVISRANCSSALAAAAYRSASRLHDERLDRHNDFSNKAGVVHSEVMLPEGAPERLSDRERVWNEVEAAEKRIDAQLAREVEFAIPRELEQGEGVRLAREFVQREFVDRDMIADLNVHWDIGADGDPEQLQAIEAGAAFRSIAERNGSVEITDIRRQQEEWQRSATRQLATGRTVQAIDTYERRGHVHSPAAPAAPSRPTAPPASSAVSSDGSMKR